MAVFINFHAAAARVVFRANNACAAARASEPVLSVAFHVATTFIQKAFAFRATVSAAITIITVLISLP